MKNTQTKAEPASPPNLPWRHVGTEGGWDGVADASGSLICRLALNIPDNATFIAEACSKYQETARQRDASFAARDELAGRLTRAHAIISDLEAACGSYQARVAELEKQRDELLAACEKAGKAIVNGRGKVANLGRHGR